MRNWKTTLAGIGAILAVIAKIIVQVTGGQPVDLDATDVGLLSAGVGGVAARDHNRGAVADEHR
ncbi:MAG: hypothetical protein A3E78_04265 [Alphaproteobacteria bacterium RIFCSPHIGHO2_12_FULL_63_12]|nr:MAG: hypothetical protein A3E78_04265 [Alphaproteobacteria bacterium RIFCSPHIGHO2_12_FULL_63_12]